MHQIGGCHIKNEAMLLHSLIFLFLILRTKCPDALAQISIIRIRPPILSA